MSVSVHSQLLDFDKSSIFVTAEPEFTDCETFCVLYKVNFELKHTNQG